VVNCLRYKTYLQYNTIGKQYYWEYKARVTMDICHDGPSRFYKHVVKSDKDYLNT